jgi:hypothetical protein
LAATDDTIEAFGVEARVDPALEAKMSLESCAMRTNIIGMTILIGLLSACGSAAAPGANTPSVTATRPPTIAPLPTSTGEPLPADVLAIYHKSGCIDGRNETLIVHFDGTLETMDTRGTTQQAQVEADQLVALKELLAQPEFAELQPLYQAAGADLCVYTVTTQRDGQSFSVTTMDAAKTPELLRQVLQELERLRAEVQRK